MIKIAADKPIQLGSRRELFFDDFLIAGKHKVERRIHHPVKREVVLEIDAPHEFCNQVGYESIIRDGNRWILYYRAGGRFPSPKYPEVNENWILCAAETTDGKHFRRCKVNLCPEGENVVLNKARTDGLTPSGYVNICPATSTVFYDDNPECPSHERFKMIVTNERPPDSPKRGMYLYVSADGFDFRRKSAEKFALKPGSGFDSANIAFYDPEIKEYRLYHRSFKMAGKAWRRCIMTHTTPDFVHFHGGQQLHYNREFNRLFAAGQQLYTNNIQPYFRAPHILVGFPGRYYEQCATDAKEIDWNPAVLTHDDVDLRAFATKYEVRIGIVTCDCAFIASRNGTDFTGFGEAFLPPGPQHGENYWRYGDNYFVCGMIPTKADIEDAPDELSFYFNEGEWTDKWAKIRRCSLRQDGFVSLYFPPEGGEIVTRPFVFDGGRLSLNIATSGFGRFQAEFQTPEGNPVPGFSMQDSYSESGDALDLIARWKKSGPDVRALAGKQVRLKITGRDAHLYALQFVPFIPDRKLPPCGKNN